MKCSYENLKAEFQRLEERGSFVGEQKQSGSQPQTPHHQGHHSQSHPSPSNYSSLLNPQTSEQAQDVLTCNEIDLFIDDSSKATPPSPSIIEPEIPVTPTPKSQSFISRFFRFKSSSHSSQSPGSPNTNL